MRNVTPQSDREGGDVRGLVFCSHFVLFCCKIEHFLIACPSLFMQSNTMVTSALTILWALPGRWGSAACPNTYLEQSRKSLVNWYISYLYNIGYTKTVITVCPSILVMSCRIHIFYGELLKNTSFLHNLMVSWPWTKDWPIKLQESV